MSQKEELCCVLNSIDQCYSCEQKVCETHSKPCLKESRELGCKCGSCFSTDTVHYCIECYEIEKPEDD